MSKEMSLSELYPQLICASFDDHIVKEPINLACSHVACKSCIPKYKSTIKCKFCGTNQNITVYENFLMKKLIVMSLPELFNGLEKRMREQIKTYKGKFSK